MIYLPVILVILFIAIACPIAAMHGFKRRRRKSSARSAAFHS